MPAERLAGGGIFPDPPTPHRTKLLGILLLQPAPRLQRRRVVHHLNNQGTARAHLNLTHVEAELGRVEREQRWSFNKGSKWECGQQWGGCRRAMPTARCLSGHMHQTPMCWPAQWASRAERTLCAGPRAYARPKRPPALMIFRRSARRWPRSRGWEGCMTPQRLQEREVWCVSGSLACAGARVLRLPWRPCAAAHRQQPLAAC